MFRKMLFIATGLIVVLAAPAAAQYDTSAVIQASKSAVIAGEPFSVTGEGFPPDTVITLTLVEGGATKAAPAGVALGTTTSTGGGTFSASVTIPGGTPTGTYTIEAVGGGKTADTVIEVVSSSTATTTPSTGSSGTGTSSGGSPGTSSGTLPRTGAGDTMPLTVAGATLLALGGVVVLSVRRRPGRLA